jgi:NADH dehydrogenase FAD-containing subunit
MPDGAHLNKIQTGVTNLDALIIGAGFSGLYQLLSLRDKLGLNAKVVERQETVLEEHGIGTDTPVHAVTQRAIRILIILIKNY